MEIIWKTLTKIKIFRLIFSKIMIFLKLWTKWTKSKILTEFGIIKILTKFDIVSEISDKNRYFRKSWLKSRFFDNFDRCQDCQKNLTTINIFRKYWPKSTFLNLLTRITSFMNFVQNQDFRQFWQNRDNVQQFFTKFDNFKSLGKIKIF